MTTEWQPDIDKLLASVAEMEGADDVKAEVEADDGDGANQGVKRKRAPYKKGPCEHGRRRSICKECGGGSICVHGRERSKCKECGGGSICEHGRMRSTCKECGGGSICEHGRRRSQCNECAQRRECEQ